MEITNIITVDTNCIANGIALAMTNSGCVAAFNGGFGLGLTIVIGAWGLRMFNKTVKTDENDSE